jgi:hypothetical protein
MSRVGNAGGDAEQDLGPPGLKSRSHAQIELTHDVNRRILLAYLTGEAPLLVSKHKLASEQKRSF